MKWDLLERFDVIKKGQVARAQKSFKGSEDFFEEHYPSKPLVPEPLFIEMIAQVGGVLFGLNLDFKKEIVLAKVSRAIFQTPVIPPCRLDIEAKIDEEREEGAWISGTVKKDGETVAIAQLLLVTMDKLGDSDAKQIIFSKYFLDHFDVYNIAKRSEGVA